VGDGGEYVGGGGVAQFVPVLAGAEAAERDALAGAEREEFLHLHAEQFAERAGVAAKPDVVIFVHDTGEVGHHQVAAGADEAVQVGGALVGDEVLHRGDDQPVAGEVVGAADEVGGDPDPVEGVVPAAGLGDVGGVHAGVRVEFRGPAGVGVVHDRDVHPAGGSGDGGAGDLGQAAQGLAEPDHLAPDLGLRPGVR